MKSNWRETSEYDFLKKSGSELIAWQFLRRNPEYQQDYAWFIATWQQLELDYGAAPNRDFSAWKKDPRAYRFERDIGFQNETSTTQCASENEKLLIECWMGAKWAFYKFPVNPDIRDPVIGSELSWRTSEVGVKLISEDLLHQEPLIIQTNKTAIIFDLNKCLKQQLQSAKQQLIVAQKNSSNGEYLIEQWILYLRVIDAIQSDANETEIIEQLGLERQEYFHIKQNAKQIMLDHYREIINYL